MTGQEITTQALVVHGPNEPFKIETIKLDSIRDDEFLVEIKYSGLCHTDLFVSQGHLPFLEYPAIYGHEGAGIVRSVGKKNANGDIQPGDAVLLSFTVCGECIQCMNGHPAYCHLHPQKNFVPARHALLENGTKVATQFFGQSSFSKLTIVNEKCVVKCSEPDHLAALTPLGCGYQTGAGTVLNVLKPGKESSIAVFGCGGVGLPAIMAAKASGVKTIIAIDVVDSKLSLAKQFGATHVVNSKTVTTDLVNTIKTITKHSEGTNFAIDCTGIAAVVTDAVKALAPCGTIAMVGVPPFGSELKIDAIDFIQGNKHMVGVIEGDSNPKEFIPRLVKMYMEGQFPIDKLSKVYSFTEFDRAVKDMHDGTVLKPILKWD